MLLNSFMRNTLYCVHLKNTIECVVSLKELMTVLIIPPLTGKIAELHLMTSPFMISPYKIKLMLKHHIGEKQLFSLDDLNHLI